MEWSREQRRERMKAGTPDRGLQKISVHNSYCVNRFPPADKPISTGVRLDNDSKHCWFCTLGTCPTEMLTYGEDTNVHWHCF